MPIHVVAAALLAVGTLSIAKASFVATDLRCENLPHPTAVDSLTPRLSWQTQSDAPNWHQSAYRILVASSSGMLSDNRGDLWDSGKVVSTDSAHIQFQGTPLQPNQVCYWKVMTWDAAGKPSRWSPVGMWEMGLLSPADWGRSVWIGNGKAGPAPYLHHEFTVHGTVKRARLFSAGLGYADLHLNGKPIAPGVERDPGYTNFDKRVLYVAHDLTKSLKPGQNCLGAILGTGWYDVHDTATWRFEKAPWRGRPRFKALLVIEYQDGTSQRVATDPTWKTATGPILTDGIYTGETYDARKEMPGWSTSGFNDRGWTQVSTMPEPKGVLAACPCPPIVIGETIKPVSIQEPKPGVFIVDFGQNFAGHAQLKVKLPAGTTIRMRYSERLDKDGMIDRAEIEKFMDRTNPPQPFQTDTYICKGGGVEEWEQIFSYSGFRYMEVTGFKPTLDNFRGRFAHTNLESGGSFECSNELLNKIQHATRYSYLSNAQNIFTDCPQREKNGWTGDAHLAAEAGLMNFDSVTLYEKWLNDVADEQHGNGATSIIIPTGGWGQGAPHPAWDSAYPIIVNDLYRYTGDLAIVRRHYDKLKHYVDGLAAQIQDGLVTFDSLGDWLPWKTETPSQLTSTAFLCLDSSIVASLARLLGHEDDAAAYTALAQKTRDAFNTKYFDADKGVYANGSQTASSTALYFGLVPPDRRDATFHALVADVEKQGHIDTGIIGAKNVLRVLSEGGRSDLAYKIVNRTEQPGWGWWIGQGATTLWEDWKGESSLNHIMFGDVSNWFIQWLGGIGLDPASPGFKHFFVRPQPVGDLTWVKASHASPYGLISTHWTRKGKDFHLTVTVPPNSSATVLLPGTGASKEIGSGSHEFSTRLP